MTGRQTTNFPTTLRRRAEEQEGKLRPGAALSSGHSRRFDLEEDHRLPYRRDVDRIVHSKAYARYIDKTQVAYLIDNDHITQRALHVQLVSNFSRGIGASLGLNLDLIEAIALGHDVGHPPFGHEGEKYLSALSKKHGCGEFSHSLQSCRLLGEIEPRNLCLAVYDGFLCHDGGMKEGRFEPCWNKSWDDHFRDREEKKNDPECNISPATLEGCLVKLCDTLSYIGRDIEDAISLGILKREAVPETHLGSSNGELLARLALDIIEESDGKDYIALSEEAFAAVKKLRSFNFQQIYIHPALKVESAKIKRSYGILFELLLQELEKEGEKSYVWNHYLHNKPTPYVSSSSPAQQVVDFIAGMTDRYFIKTVEKWVVPKNIELLP